jgi:hypothetical protein
MYLFEAIVVLHVVAGATGLISFWVPIAARKGAAAHRRWGRIAARALAIAGSLAIAMALLSLYGPEQRLPMITDRVVFRGLFGWMMLYLGMLTICFADYGLAVVRHRATRHRLRGVRYQIVFATTAVLALNCGSYGLAHGLPLMAMVAGIGLIAVGTQLAFIWRTTVDTSAYVREHFRALMGMGISAYTAFLSVGLIRLVPDHVFNPLIWAIPSLVGVALIIRFTLKTTPRVAGVRGSSF